MNKLSIIIYLFIFIINTNCKESSKINESSEKNSIFVDNQENCEKILHQLISSSDYDVKDNFKARIEENRNDTIIIKSYLRNNLSDDANYIEIVESVDGWFIIPPNKDALYLSLNAMDPLEPNFRKIKVNQTILKQLLDCINNNSNNMKEKINFTDLFNEVVIIKFTPSDLEKENPEIKDFKLKLEKFSNKYPLSEDFDNSNLSYLINNETFFDLQYYTDSSWLEFFILKY